MADKIYCGNGKKITTKYGDMMRLSISEADLKLLQDNIENGWVNVKVFERREPSQTGMTHYLVIDDWKPDQRSDVPKPEAAEPTVTKTDDLPF